MTLRIRQPGFQGISAAGAQTLSPPLVTNTQTFFTPTITAGAVTLTPALFTNTQTFFTPTISQSGGTVTLLPTLVINDNVFFSPTMTGGVTFNVTAAGRVGTQWGRTWYQKTQDAEAEADAAIAKARAIVDVRKYWADYGDLARWLEPIAHDLSQMAAEVISGRAEDVDMDTQQDVYGTPGSPAAVDLLTLVL